MPNFPQFHASIFISSPLLLLAAISTILAQPLPPPFIPHPRCNTPCPIPTILNPSVGINPSLPSNPNIYHGDHDKSQQEENNQPQIFNETMAREFVDAHNVARLQFSHPFLIWDVKLAIYAQQWAKKRVNDCKMIHSYGPYGENIFWGGRDHWTPKEAVEYWMEEKEFYNTNTNECAPQKMCGHYTQVVWKNTTRVGCSRTRCLNGGLLIFCEYDPPGNYVNENPFGKVLNTLVDHKTIPLNPTMPTPIVPSGQPQNVAPTISNPMLGQTQIGSTPSMPSRVKLQPRNIGVRTIPKSVEQAPNGATQLIPNPVSIQQQNGGTQAVPNSMLRQSQNGNTSAIPNQIRGQQQNGTPLT